MQLSFRGSVNRWECDENDHLNVRFCEEKLWQTFTSGLLDRGLIRADQIADLPAKLSRQQIRFQNESRLSARLSGYFTSVEHPDFNVGVLLVNDLLDAPAFSMMVQVDGLAADLGAQQTARVESDWLQAAMPRGISTDFTLGRLDLSTLSVRAAKDLGFQTIGRGTVLPDECTGSGLMMPHSYIGRTSDAMPHLWSALGKEETEDADQGGAVVEFRKCLLQPLRQGQRVEVASGVVAVGSKVQQLAHLIFNVAEDRIAMTVQAVVVRMDLNARKSVALSESEQARLRALQISP